VAQFQLEIFTQEKRVFDGPVDALTAPGEEGYLGVLAHHAPLLTTLGRGKLTVRVQNKQTEYALAGGFLEVHDNKATVLADKLEEEPSQPQRP
jgi:F-type H+-transporting ATPase subunit epsilon